MQELIGAATVIQVGKAATSVWIFRARLTQPSNLNKLDRFWIKILRPSHLRTAEGQIEEITDEDRIFLSSTNNVIKVGDKLTVVIRRTRYQDWEPEDEDE